jgi:hypothetical protein
MAIGLEFDMNLIFFKDWLLSFDFLSDRTHG